MTEISELEIRKAVKERYAKLGSSKMESGCQTSNSACCNPLIQIGNEIPTEAAAVSAGCGSPLLLVAPREGETVLDLGSGGGIDVFRASTMVGETGKAIGVDATPEMIWRARETAKKYADKYKNVEFRLGEIEHLPIESESMDYVISNCVINLSPDKPKVFRESFRVLKNGGTFAVADVTLPKEIPEDARKDMDSWSACLAGALTDSDYTKLLQNAGFRDIEIEHVSTTNIGEYQFPYHSSHIKARKSS
jgi:arsenite methyltransferase